MEIVNFGHFTASSKSGIVYFTNDEGHDWYDIRFGLTQWDEKGEFLDAIYGAWAMVSPEGVITNVEYDPSRLMPGDRTVLGIDASHEEITEGMIYRDGVILPKPEITPDELRATYPELTPPTFWKAARQIGVYKADVLAQINAIPDEETREDALIDLEECTGFRRLHPLIVSLIPTHSITPEQLDDLWLWAANQQA